MGRCSPETRKPPSLPGVFGSPPNPHSTSERLCLPCSSTTSDCPDLLSSVLRQEKISKPYPIEGFNQRKLNADAPGLELHADLPTDVCPPPHAVSAPSVPRPVSGGRHTTVSLEEELSFPRPRNHVKKQMIHFSQRLYHSMKARL